MGIHRFLNFAHAIFVCFSKSVNMTNDSFYYLLLFYNENVITCERTDNVNRFYFFFAGKTNPPFFLSYFLEGTNGE